MAKFTVHGTRQLSAKLKALSAELKADLRKSLDKTADEAVAYAKALAPVDSSELRDSIRRRDGDHELHVIVEADADYALHVEGGTKDTKARPFFRPGVRLAIRKGKRRQATAVGRVAKKLRA
jgi:HK97 gp10 family phage protein